jgi:hypothetical protein
MSFAAPFMLGALLLLPLLWWLMRLLPPAPRVQPFPAIALLTPSDAQSAQQRLPWWLMLLRLLLAALLIFGLAHPMWRSTDAPKISQQLTLVIDTGWTSATRFGEMRDLAFKAIAESSSAATKIRLLSTAAPSTSAAEWLSPALARQRLETLTPMPWAAARSTLLQQKAVGDTIWISDGLEPATAPALIAWAKTAGRVRVMEATRLPPLQLVTAQSEAAGIAVTVIQAKAALPRSVTIAAQAADGSQISLATTSFARGETRKRVLVPLAPGAHVRITQLRIVGEASSGAVYLLDRRNARVFVGLSSRDRDMPQPLRSADFYVQRALQTHADVARGDIAALLARGVNMLMLPDNLPEAPALRTQLQAWVARGGVLVLFAGPRSTQLGSSLLPVPLRQTTRSLGGAMSWGKPATLGAWAAARPFAGLAIPADVTVRQQWLAEPSLATTAQSWAQLADSTPLVSAQTRGQGLVVLFHTSANADWSNLVLSGLFEQMLLRLLPMAASMDTKPAGAAQSYQLQEALNGFGAAAPATHTKIVLATTLENARAVSAAMPPGRYVSQGKTAVVNVGGAMPGWIDSYRGAELLTASHKARQTFDARALLFGLAALLLLLDGLATLYLKGLFKRPRLRMFAALMAFASPAAQAAPAGAFDVRLCAVRGSADTDALAGLQNLTGALKFRTAITVGEPMLVGLSDRNLGLCTMLYWPISSSTPMLDGASAARLQRYMAQGGLLMVDSGWNSASATDLRRVIGPLQLPRLENFSATHVLAKSFYLLERAPGSFDFSSLWLESGTGGADGRTTQIILANTRWAAQWRAGDNPLVQERALRLGVNVVIYALTGTYKADQVHAAGLLERMARKPR